MKWTEKKIEKMGDDLLEWMKEKKNFWLKDFAIENGIYSQKFSEWSKRNEYFAEKLAMAKEIQESRLLHMGLSKKFNVAMAVFALKNVAKWRDKQEQVVIDERQDIDLSKLSDKELLEFKKLIAKCE